MSLNAEYLEYQRRRVKLMESPMKDIWMEQEKRYVKPFKMFGNLYYVGDSWVCVHLIDTGDGLLLFDSGNVGGYATAMLVQQIWELGFNPRDVKWIVLSHGHMDHFGGVNFFKNMFGTKIYLGKPDADNLKNRPELSMVQKSTDYADGLFEPDVEIEDGDIYTFGNTTVRFCLTPGHTEGVIACFFDVTDGMEVKRVGFFGGFGFNTLQKDYLLEIGDTEYKMRNCYLHSIQKVIDEPVDIFMPSHSDNVNLLQKLKEWEEHPDVNPFINSMSWKLFLQKQYNAMVEFMADPNNN